MGNFCDVPSKEAVYEVAAGPQGTPRGERVPLGRSLSMVERRSTFCSATELETLTEEHLNEWKNVPDCLIPVDHESEWECESEELDFSKDLLNKERRPSAVASEQDQLTAHHMLVSPARQNAEELVPCGWAQVRPSGGSFYLRQAPGTGQVPGTTTTTLAPGTTTTQSPQKTTTQATTTSTLQRSNSSYMMNTTALRNLQRSDSSYVMTKKPMRSDSTVIFNLAHCASSIVLQNPMAAANRSKSAPAGRIAEQISTAHLVEDIALDGPAVSAQELLQKLRGKLRVSPNARIEAMSGFNGGQNKGMWMLHDSPSSLVLKLVDGSRKHPSIATEAEQLVKLSTEYPGIRSDPSLTFPIKVFGFSDPRSGRRFHLLVMKKASGKPLSDVISIKISYKQVPQLLQILESLGRFIAGVHKRYNSQHNDFQPSNIFFDETTSQFTLIDVGGMGSSSSVRNKDGDVEHFGESLRMLSNGMGCPMLATEGKTHFMKGYNAGR